MPLSGSQHKQIQDALIAAFGNEDNLRQMLRLQMSVNLESVAKPGNMAQRTFDVVTWADEQGRVGELVQAACAAESPKSGTAGLWLKPVKSWHIEAACTGREHRRTRAWNSTALPTPRCSSGARR